MAKQPKPAAIARDRAGHLIRLLFIGNSFTNRNDLPGMLERLAASAMPALALHTERIIANGMSFKAHCASR